MEESHSPSSSNDAASATPAGAKATGPRCVLWHGAGGRGPGSAGGGAGIPGELLQSLSRKIPRITISDDAYDALANVVTDRGGGPSGGKGVVLIIVEPREQPEAAEIYESLRRYAPKAACWMYSRGEIGGVPIAPGLGASGANSMLRAVVESDVLAWNARTSASSVRATYPRSTPHSPEIVVRNPIPEIVPRPARQTGQRDEPLTPPLPSPHRAPHAPQRRGSPASSPRLRLAGLDDDPVLRSPPAPNAGTPIFRPPTSTTTPPPETPTSPTSPGTAADKEAPPALTEQELRMLLDDDETA